MTAEEIITSDGIPTLVEITGTEDTETAWNTASRDTVASEPNSDGIAATVVLAVEFQASRFSAISGSGDHSSARLGSGLKRS